MIIKGKIKFMITTLKNFFCLKKISTKTENKFIIHPLFLLLSLFFVFLGQGIFYIVTLLVVILHEYAHFYVAKCKGYKLNQMCLLPFGAQLNLSTTIFNSKDEIQIAIAGPLFNLILATFCIALWWIFPVTYVYTSIFVQANVVIALFNFLPILPLDGSRVALAIFNKFGKRDKCYKLLNIINIVSSIILLLGFLHSAFFEINWTLGIMSLFIFLSAFENEEAYKYSSLFKNSKSEYLQKSALKIKYFAITKKVNKINIFKLINQNYFLVLLVLDDDLKPIKYIYENELDKYFNNEGEEAFEN